MVCMEHSLSGNMLVVTTTIYLIFGVILPAQCKGVSMTIYLMSEVLQYSATICVLQSFFRDTFILLMEHFKNESFYWNKFHVLS